MKIRLTKENNGKSGTLTCLRTDGSCTWQPSSAFFAHHDLIHYAVEKTLGYHEAFFGLIAMGKGLDEFGTKNGVKDVYTLQAMWAEGIVGTLQWPSMSGGGELAPAEVVQAVMDQCTHYGCPAPSLTIAQVERIRVLVRALHRRWGRVPAGESMELTF